MPVRFAVAASLCLLVAAPIHAHEPDTSYSRLFVSADRLTTEITFDLTVLSRFAPIDVDRDGRITRGELAAAAPRIADRLRRAVSISLDDGPPELGGAGEPAWNDEREVIPSPDWGVVLVDFPFERSLAARPELITLLYDIWPIVGDRHAHLATIRQDYTDDFEIVFRANEPDFDFYTSAPPPVGAQIARFVRLGAEHIFVGYDHILFLLALILVSRLGSLVKVITAFTVAHAVTLTAAALELVEVPAWIVESGIAATIVYVAVDNVARGERSAHGRWPLVFAFGLVHGFGFANVLRELGLPTEGLVRALLSFNIGIELGQLLIVLALYPACRWVRGRPRGASAVSALSAAIGIVGALWLVDRVMGLERMPF